VQVSLAEPRKINAHLIRDIEQATFDQRLLTLITRLFERLEKLWLTYTSLPQQVFCNSYPELSSYPLGIDLIQQVFLCFPLLP
jgi:hypothetical protein